MDVADEFLSYIGEKPKKSPDKKEIDRERFDSSYRLIGNFVWPNTIFFNHICYVDKNQ